MNPKPVSVLVLSILGIVYGGLMLLLTMFSLAANMFHLMGPNPMLRELEADTLYKVFTVGSGCTSIVLSAVVVAGSIGSLMLKNWGRITMLGWSVVWIVYNFFATIFAMIYVVPLMTKAMSAADPRMARAAMIGGYVGGACGALFHFVLPILVLVFFTRRKVVNAFHGIFEAARRDFPVGDQSLQGP
jgi:hypothetical protein